MNKSHSELVDSIALPVLQNLDRIREIYHSSGLKHTHYWADKTLDPIFQAVFEAGLEYLKGVQRTYSDIDSITFSLYGRCEGKFVECTTQICLESLLHFRWKSDRIYVMAMAATRHRDKADFEFVYIER
jgi:hypothetical protein